MEIFILDWIILLMKKFNIVFPYIVPLDFKFTMLNHQGQKVHVVTCEI
jgi:hypothetical protein